MRHQDTYFHSIVLLTVMICGTSARAQAQLVASLNTIHQFTGTPDGANPGGILGEVPGKTLIADTHGALYGTTENGGANGLGTVFRLTPPMAAGGAWAETILYSFSDGAIGGAPGAAPLGGLVFDTEGNLYGTTSSGGNPRCTYGCGLIFQLARPGTPNGSWGYHVLYSFTGGGDGRNPQGSLVFDEAGALYGAAVDGGNLTACPGVPGCGVVFRLTPPSTLGAVWIYNVLHTFNGSDGAGPGGNLVFDSNGVLYGTTYGGGSGTCVASGCGGTVFSLTRPASSGTGWTETQLHGFTGASDGSHPAPSLVFDSNGVLYGATEWGGYGAPFPCPYGCGTLFQLTPPAQSVGTWNFATIVTFMAPYRQGATPCCLVFSKTGNLYGVAEQGWADHWGAIYRLSPPSTAGAPWFESVLYTFGSQSAFPNGLLVGNGGVLYGTTSGGEYPADPNGSVFQLVP